MDNNKIIITISELKDVLELSSNLRQDDINEVRAIGSTPYTSLLKGYIYSDECYTAKWKSKVIGMFGVSNYDLPKGFGSIWFLGTDEMTKHPITFVKEGFNYTNKWLETYNILLNVVDCRNIKHIEWLKRIGMKFSSPITINNNKFIQFYKVRRKNV